MSTKALAMDADLYNAGALAQASLHTLAAQTFVGAATAAAKAAVKHGDGAVRILVSGAATGANDAAAIKKDMVPAIRAVTKLPIQVVFSDLPSNNYNTLADEAMKLEDPAAEVWCSCKIGYGAQRIVGADFHLVITMSTLHWLVGGGSYPKDLTTGKEISYVTLKPEAQETFRASADAELLKFFSARMAELRSGGQVVAVFDGETSERPHQFSDTYYLIEKSMKSMIADGLLPEKVLENFFVYTCSYSEERCKAVLDKCGGNLVGTKFLDIPCPYHLAWKEDKDAAKHGDGLAKATMAFSKQNIIETFGKCGVAEDKIEGLLKQLYDREAKFAGEEPDKYNTSGITAFIQIEKADT